MYTAIEHHLYILLKEHKYQEIEELIIKHNLLFFTNNDLFLKKNSGILSNLIKYYIVKNNETVIRYIVAHDNLMKRDYLLISNYYYKFNYQLSEHVFDKLDLNSLESKDIDYIIDNVIIHFIYKLNGLFIKSNIKYNNSLDINNLKIFYINEESCIIYKKLIELKINFTILKKLKNFKLIIPEINFIIDAANILHSDCGNITDKSINGLKKILENTSNPLIIIHEKYFKNIEIKNILLQYNYYLTPFKHDDDLFILWFFFTFYSKSYIITNDLFKNHNFNFNFKNDYNILLQQLICYSIDDYTISYPPIYSNCIQVNDDLIYIPN